jgi:hypothetical protein
MKMGLVASTAPEPIVSLGAISNRVATARHAASSGIHTSAPSWAARAGAARPSTMSRLTRRQLSPVASAGMRYSRTGANEVAVTTRTVDPQRASEVSVGEPSRRA